MVNHLVGGLIRWFSPACFVAAENSMDMQLSKILKASGQDGRFTIHNTHRGSAVRDDQPAFLVNWLENIEAATFDYCADLVLNLPPSRDAR